MAHEWIFIGILLLLGIVFAALPLVVNSIIAPRQPHPLKNQTYECGMETVGDTWIQFKVQYYIFSLVFVIFDVEIVFLFPWAVSLGNLGALGFWSMMIFLFILTIGFVYEWKKGALDWD